MRFISFRFFFAFLRNLTLKIRYREKISIGLFSTYISPGVVVRISGAGRIVFSGNGKRIFVSRGCEIRASDGTLTIGSGTYFNINCMVVSHCSVEIGRDVMFGPGVCVFDSDHRYDDRNALFSEQGYVVKPVVIGSNVWVGAYSVIAKGARIGVDSVFGAHSLITGTHEGGGVYVGAPARLIKKIR